MSRAGAEERAQKAGAPTGILRTDDYSALTPGYWAVFSGQHATPATAKRATDQWRLSGYGDAYWGSVGP